MVFKESIHTVARCAGHVADDEAVFAEDGVDEAGFADVRAADNGDADKAAVLFFAGIRREVFKAGVEQIARPVAVQRGDRHRIAQPEIIELVQLRRRSAELIDFVDAEDDRTSRALEHRGDLRIRGGHAGQQICDKNNDVCVFNGDFRLQTHELQNFAVGTRLNAAGIDNLEGTAPPFTVAVEPVACDARRILDDGAAGSGQFIEQHRLSDVRTADDGNDGLLHSLST